MQQLPYVVVTNPHISEVYELYYNAFDMFRKVKEIKTLEDNDAFCKTISQMLKAHQAVIPKLMMGTLESSGLMDPAELDKFMNTILKAVRVASTPCLLRVLTPSPLPLLTPPSIRSAYPVVS